MASQTFTYKGKKITITEEDDRVELTIDDRAIQVDHDPGTGHYRAPQESFMKYTSLVELAKSIVDNIISRQ